MKKATKSTVLTSCLLFGGWTAFAQAPTVSPTSLTFTPYQVGAAKFPAALKLVATLPSTIPSSTVMTQSISYTSQQVGWLTVTPGSGVTPFTMSVAANPTSLSPGTYLAKITISPAGYTSTSVTVTLTVTNPPSSLLFTSANFDPLPSGATTNSLTFNYTAGAAPAPYEIDVSTNGDIIPFTATAAVGKASSGTTANWLRVNNIVTAPTYSTSTSGVAAAGSSARIGVALDQSTLNNLDAIIYNGTLTITWSGGTTVVNVILNISAGTPSLQLVNSAAIFPQSMPAYAVSPPVKPMDPTITLVGDNFFANASHVFISQPGGIAYPLPQPTWLSRQILQTTIPVQYLTFPSPYYVTLPATWQVVVVNGAPGSNPSNSTATSNTAIFTVTDPTFPYVQNVVNAASYLTTATQLGTIPNPAAPPLSAVSPREIISIFGQNLGPTTLVPNSPQTCLVNAAATCYLPTVPGNAGVHVEFVSGGVTYNAPLIMIAANQINAIVPAAVPVGPVTINVTNDPGATGNANLTYSYTSGVVVAEDPGIFTFGGNGQGQAAVLNWDASTGTVTVNGKQNAAPRGSAIQIYATGLGDLKPAGGLEDGQVTAGPNWLLDDTYRVLIDGQSAAVSYGGTEGSGVAGLVQLNAIVPPNAKTGAAIPITVEIGPVDPVLGVTARRSQASVTIAVK